MDKLKKLASDIKNEFSELSSTMETKSKYAEKVMFEEDAEVFFASIFRKLLNDIHWFKLEIHGEKIDSAPLEKNRNVDDLYKIVDEVEANVMESINLEALRRKGFIVPRAVQETLMIIGKDLNDSIRKVDRFLEKC